jgi:hypothetical protein
MASEVRELTCRLASRWAHTHTSTQGVLCKSRERSEQRRHFPRFASPPRQSAAHRRHQSHRTAKTFATGQFVQPSLGITPPLSSSPSRPPHHRPDPRRPPPPLLTFVVTRPSFPHPACSSSLLVVSPSKPASSPAAPHRPDLGRSRPRRDPFLPLAK